MEYRDILERLSKKENISKEEVEQKMSEALAKAGIFCSPQEFVQQVAERLKETIYRKIV